MFTVALVGADGAGKTTLARRLQAGGELPIRYVYMGINPEASNHVLPTTRLVRGAKKLLGLKSAQGGPPDPDRARRRPRSVLKRAALRLKSNLRLANQIAEEWYRQGLARWYRARGFIVLFDRHFFCDFRAHDVPGRGPLLRRLHGFLLRRVYPRPALTIVLDAPAAVLLARKGEGTLELLERRRREYLELTGNGAAVTVIDASRPPDDVMRDVVDAIRRFGEAGR